MNNLFRIAETGQIEGTQLHFIKGQLEVGLLKEHFIGKIDIGSRIVEIEVQGKALIPISSDPTLKTYVLKVANPTNYDLGDLVDRVMMIE